MPEPIMLLAKSLHWAVRKVQTFEQSKVAELERAYTTAKEDWRLEFQQRAEQRLSALEETAENFERLAQLLTDEFYWMLKNYEVEGFREPRRKRRSMLAAAAAGSFNPAFTVAQLIRVERTLRELDPEDIEVLHTMRAVGGLLRRAPDDVSSEVLVAAGCLRTRLTWDDDDDNRALGGVAVTRLGEDVLAVLDGYEPTEEKEQR